MGNERAISRRGLWSNAQNAKGLCRSCPGAVLPGRTTCAYHNALQRERSRRKRAALIESGVCIAFGCGEKAAEGTQRCRFHGAQFSRYTSSRRSRINKEKRDE